MTRVIIALLFAMLALPAMAEERPGNAAYLRAYITQHFGGVYTSGGSLIYVDYDSDMVLIIGGREIETKTAGIDTPSNSITFRIKREDKPELVTLKRIRSLAVMTMGDGSVFRMSYVRPLTDIDIDEVKRIRAGG